MVRTAMPGNRQQAGSTSHGQDSSVGSEPKHKRILIVDDEPSVRNYLTQVLAGKGYVVDEAPSCLDALLCIFQARYHSLILDLLIPDVNGLVLYDQVRRLDRDLARRTIFITGSGESHPLLHQARETSLPVLPKPFPASRLLEILESQCAGPCCA